MAVVETVRHTGTVIHEFHHMTTEVRLFIDTQSVGASILRDKKNMPSNNNKLDKKTMLT